MCIYMSTCNNDTQCTLRLEKNHEFKAYYSKEKQFIHIYAILMR